METILITGGTGKLGSRLVEHFHKKGYRVIFTSTSEERSHNLRNRLGENPNIEIIAANLDLGSSDSIKALLNFVRTKDIHPHHLVNNARSLASLDIQSDGRTSRENFLKELEIDVVAPYELTMSLADEHGSKLRTVVNIGSQYGMVAANPALYTDHKTQSPIQYSVAKAALNHLTKELAVRLAPKGIRVNCVAFGGMEGRTDQDFKERYSKLNPIGRMLHEEEISGPVEFLISNSSSSITGQTLPADGGWTIW